MTEDDNLEVVWSGGPLLPDRPTKVGDTWRRPKRAWNRKPPTVPIINVLEDDDNNIAPTDELTDELEGDGD